MYYSVFFLVVNAMSVVINLLSDSDAGLKLQRQKPNSTKKEIVNLVSSSSCTDNEHDTGSSIMTSHRVAQRNRELRLKALLSYAKQPRPHYQRALEWYKELDQLAQNCKSPVPVPAKIEPPLLYDDSECQDCLAMMPRRQRVLTKAFDTANDGLSSLPKLVHPFLQDAPQFRPPSASPGRSFSVCYLYDDEGPRSVLATRNFAILCGPCTTLRLAVLKYLVEYRDSASSPLVHWEPLLNVHEKHSSLEAATNNWLEAKGILC